MNFDGVIITKYVIFYMFLKLLNKEKKLNHIYGFNYIQLILQSFDEELIDKNKNHSSLCHKCYFIVTFF